MGLPDQVRGLPSTPSLLPQPSSRSMWPNHQSPRHGAKLHTTHNSSPAQRQTSVINCCINTHQQFLWHLRSPALCSGSRPFHWNTLDGLAVLLTGSLFGNHHPSTPTAHHTHSNDMTNNIHTTSAANCCTPGVSHPRKERETLGMYGTYTHSEAHTTPCIHNAGSPAAASLGTRGCVGVARKAHSVPHLVDGCRQPVHHNVAGDGLVGRSSVGPAKHSTAQRGTAQSAVIQAWQWQRPAGAALHAQLCLAYHQGCCFKQWMPC